MATHRNTVAKRTQHVALNNVGLCCVGMLRSFGRGLMSKTIAVHVRYNFVYISLPSSVKQQRELTKFCAVYGSWTTTANFSHLHLELSAVAAYLT